MRTWTLRMLVVLLVVAAIVGWRSYQASTGLSTTESGQRFIDGIDSAWWGVAAYVAVYVLRPLVLFPASVLTVMGGILFGAWWGILVVVVAANASAMVAYGIGLVLAGRCDDPDRSDTIFDRTGTSADERRSFASTWGDRLRENSFETVFTMRLLFLPYDAVNYGCGALRIRWAPFLLATALGSLPGTISFVLLGASLERIDEGIGGINPWAVVAGVAIFAASVTISRVYRKRHA
ncbi:TVP38/TMEM64 family protein [Ilumatobacter sp.]|uniref:TVP38/TMEM64 family protein n=1 Tax=Ilumatobacter sp. TaxID=1967498 RepID=UPI003C69BD2E